jgi:hypothetical protein
MCGALLTLGKGNVDAAPGGEVGKITVIGTMMSGVGGNGQSAHNLAAGLRGLCLGEREVDGEGAQGWQMKQRQWAEMGKWKVLRKWKVFWGGCTHCGNDGG